MHVHKQLLLAAALAIGGTCAMTATPAQARVHVDVYANVAPPPLRAEVVPAPRRGYVWVPGYWEWPGHRHLWMQGYWVKARPGYHYREPRWVEHGGRWNMQPGGWDRDGDGIPNRRDRDRDGDGVPNRYDQRPDNPYRR